MKNKVRTKKLALSTLTIQQLTVDQLVDARGGALPVTSRRPDCGCA